MELRTLNASVRTLTDLIRRRLHASGRTKIPRPLKPVYDPVPYRAIVDAFHQMLPHQPRIGELTPDRRRILSELWGRFDGVEGGNMEAIRGLFERFGRARFLLGKPFASLWWMLQPERFAKIREGYYDAEELFR